jgi:hypothetical protein
VPPGAKNTYVREDQVLPHLTAIAILLGRDQAPSAGAVHITAPDEAAALIDQLRAADITLTYDRTRGPFMLATAASWQSPSARTADTTRTTARGRRKGNS